MNWKNLITLTLLSINSWRDLRRKQIYLIPTVLYGLAGMILIFCFEHPSPYDFILRMVPGVFLLLVGKISGGKIGYGDGLVTLSLGIWNGFSSCLTTLSSAFVLIFIFSVILLSIRKFKGDTELPMIPFLLISYIGRILI